METRRFTVVDTRNNNVVTIESQASTLGELKTDLHNNGIRTEGMTIQEGLTNTELINDDSVLPHDVPYRGTITNNLVFKVTQSGKNIASGNMSRRECYDFINVHRLQDMVKTAFGKNYTQVTTEGLVNFIASLEENNECEQCQCECKDMIENIKTALDVLVESLYEDDFIGACTYNTVKSTLSKEKPLYSKEELDAMFAKM